SRATSFFDSASSLDLAPGLSLPAAKTASTGYAAPATTALELAVHMNGRIYDPLLGRMLSADIVVQAPGNLQSYNRYSYVANNPLSKTDPTGFTTQELIYGIAAGLVESNVPDAINPFRSDQSEAPDVTRGRAMGNILGMMQGASEMSTGGGAAGGGTLVAVGSGGTLSPIAVPVAAGGVLVATHGAAVATNAAGHLSTNLERINQNKVKAGSDKGQVDPKARGKESEKRVLDDMGEKKNTEKVSTSEGDTIPDFQNSKQVGEIKDTKTVSNTAQIRAQKETAATTGREHVIVTGKETHVTPNAAKDSTVIRREDLGPKKKKPGEL
ncbi:MAG: RHS repeat-associated core domain-containing protein, partial [Opitutaceae bacterium]